MSAQRSGLERKSEGVGVAGVDEDRVPQYIAANQALDMLAAKRCADRDRLQADTIRQHEPHEVLVAAHIG